jgi:hypothetical protein
MKQLVLLVIILVLLVCGLVAFFLWDKDVGSEEPTPIEQPDTGDEMLRLPIEPLAPVVQYPVPGTPSPSGGGVREPDAANVTAEELAEQVEPLPKLDESDESIKRALQELIAPQPFEALFLPDALVRHFVVTIDNMTARKLPQRYAFTAPPKGKFSVRSDRDEKLFLDAKNYRRYLPFVRLAEVVDTQSLVSMYVRYYPILQQGYEELGYPNKYFNDRLIEVIDHLLTVPDVTGPIELQQPKVYYVFADPELESLSAGRKIMIRIGPESAMKVKAKLRELRQALIGLSE